MVTPGDGLSAASFNVSLAYGGVYSAPTANGTFTAGVPANAIPFASAKWDNETTPGTTTFVSNSGFTGIIDVLGLEDADFLLVRGYDYNGSGNGFTAADAPLVYAQSLTWTLSSDTGSFAAGTYFTVSMDGQQYSNLENVPEPSALMILGFVGILGAIYYSRRRWRAA